VPPTAGKRHWIIWPRPRRDGGLSTLLLMQTLGGKAVDLQSLLPFLMLNGSKGDTLQTLLLMRAGGGDWDIFSDLFGGNSGDSQSGELGYDAQGRRLASSKRNPETSIRD
jgi:hypothetical protein